LLQRGEAAVKFNAEQYEQLYFARKLKNLKRQAKSMGFDLTAAQN